MAVKTFRYRRDTAGDLEAINARLPSPAALSAFAGGMIVDYDFEENDIADLDLLMAKLGFTNIATNPTTDPEEDLDGLFLFDSLFSDVTASTTDTDFDDGFMGLSLSPPQDGDYEIILSGEFQASNGNTGLEVALGKNSTTVAIADSERTLDPANANDISTFYTDSVQVGLVTTDTIHGIFRRAKGSGSARMLRRRLKIQKVKQVT